jgi:predicted transcriptional regulator
MTLGGESGNPIDLHAAVLLRALVPYRKLTHDEALFYAEQQASVFLKLTHIHEPPVQIEQIVGELGLAAGIRTEPQQEQPGMSRFDEAARDWVIALRADVPTADRSFVIAHEVKHILDNGFGERLYGPVDVMSKAQRREFAADYFATCVLMPRLWLERDWKQGMRNLVKLADRFGTSASHLQHRLEALGLIETEDETTG